LQTEVFLQNNNFKFVMRHNVNTSKNITSLVQARPTANLDELS